MKKESTSPSVPTVPAMDFSKPEICDRIEKLEIQAHRGAFDRPENMLSAFHRAVDLGADFVEMDLQISKDGEIVVAHDAHLKHECRDAGGQPLTQEIFFRNLTLKEIKSYDCGAAVRSTERSQAEHVGTLTEVLTSLKARKTLRGQVLGLNIEIKYNPTQPQFYPPRVEYVNRILKAIDQSKYPTSKIMIQSFDIETLKVVRKKRSHLKLSPLLTEIEDVFKIVKALKAQSVSPHFDIINKDIVDRLHKKNVRVIPWTVNGDAEIYRSIVSGVDGVITDFPTKFIQIRNACKPQS